MSATLRNQKLSHNESKRKALNGASTRPRGGGTRLIIASKSSSTPFPVLAETHSVSEGSLNPNVDCTCEAILSGSEAGKSICTTCEIVMYKVWGGGEGPCLRQE